ncbi:MAG: phosphoglycolate phosphatase [Polynucleobacter sp. 24-46-87]|uniref:HAD family hydrolase n=1 Tax=Polynucleobacter sp. 35-46-11 TaxID=1970425 RepID=UPI000BD604BB|nr:HAD-IA family hydrolase [Polynucleobacter sp. 35-46-11]OYY08217.1 MAG: phosphoglycolate phosphatase [Polynucleobacter sp. 35-46-11]OZA15562.1 MAG: phosphoglycolate phosphatase [Polynucleobacter sp. 24-46-87]OZB47184.1 MAG: phosphoglycolate phosphatase [Polynucleobacter sp. 39-45-136]
MSSRLASPYKGVFFDLDGTLADTAPDLVAAANQLLIARNLTPKQYEVLRPCASAGARGLIGGAFGIDPDHPDFIPLRDEFFANYEKALLVNSVLFEGINHLLDQLDSANLPWGIVTNKSERFTHPLTELMGLRQRAVSTISGDTTLHSKPHPEPILHAARVANIDPKHAIYVGDDIRDIVAGKAAGMKTIAAAYGYCGCEEPPEAWGADYLVRHPRELLEIIFPQ